MYNMHKSFCINTVLVILGKKGHNPFILEHHSV